MIHAITEEEAATLDSVHMLVLDETSTFDTIRTVIKTNFRVLTTCDNNVVIFDLLAFFIAESLQTTHECYFVWENTLDDANKMIKSIEEIMNEFYNANCAVLRGGIIGKHVSDADIVYSQRFKDIINGQDENHHFFKTFTAVQASCMPPVTNILYSGILSNNK
jgi:hypothetical protein